MSDHAKYSPSQLPMLALCPGWQSDPTPGPAAIRGTAVHGLLAQAITGQAVQAPQDLAPLVEAGLAILESLKAEHPDLEWKPDVRLDTGIPDCYGTGDLVGIDDWSDHAVICDWKTGRGDREDAGTNLQTAAYAMGVLTGWSHVKQVQVVIGELEQEPTQTVLTLDQIRAAEVKIRAVIDAAKTAEPNDYRPSAKACQYCGRKVCAAREREATTAIAAMESTSLDAATPEQIGQALERFLPKAKLVEDFIESLKAKAMSLIAEGVEVPGWTIKETNGKREWTAPEDAIISSLAALCHDHGITTNAQALASPAEVERRIAAAIPKRGGKKIGADWLAGMSKATKRRSLEATAERSSP